MLHIFTVPFFYEPSNTFGYGRRGKRMKSKLCTYFSAEDPNAFSNTKTIHCRSFETWSEFDALSSIQLQGHRAILLGFKMAPSLHQVNVNGQTFVFISIVHWKMNSNKHFFYYCVDWICFGKHERWSLWREGHKLLLGWPLSARWRLVRSAH